MSEPDLIERHSIKPVKKECHGAFGKYVVMGIQYQNELGELGWHIRSASTVTHPYWVQNGQFNRVTFRERAVDIHEQASPTSEERAAVLAAIAKWEAE